MQDLAKGAIASPANMRLMASPKSHVTYRTNSEVGARITELLEEQGRSQVDIARAAGIEVTALNKILSGRRGLSGTELVLLAQELSVDPHSIIAVDEKPVFAMRGDADSATVLLAMTECEELIDGYLRLEALVPQA